MKSADMFDVLIVYSETIAMSSLSQEDEQPFPLGKYSHYNNAYAYFMSVCQVNGLSVAFTTSKDIVGSGECKSYWILKENNWLKINRRGRSILIFDKLFPTSLSLRSKRDMLLASPRVISYSDGFLFDLFFDKQKTHDHLSSFSIPTITIDSDKITEIDALLDALGKITNTHGAKNDFTTSFILKDRFGAGGNSIYKIDSDFAKTIQDILFSNPTKSFILQPFVSFGKGYGFKNFVSATDIRIIFEGKKIIQTYVRMAKTNDFRCNEEQGGTLIYTEQKDIPKKVLDSAEEIAKGLDKKNSLFALDFIVTDGGSIFLLEGNNCPGIDWNLELPKNEKKSKELIRIIVKELGVRAGFQKSEFMNSLESIYGYKKDSSLDLKN